jgi:uncharacterized membrane protein YebE (DUF533 family)
LVSDNCQHFCTSCRYGLNLAIEIENTKKVIKYSAYGVGIATAVGVIAYKYLNSKKTKQEETNENKDNSKK